MNVSKVVSKKKGSSLEDAVPLCDLTAGQYAKVSWVNQDNPFAGRLRDLGFVPGSIMRVRQRAPLAGPVEYEIRGSRFCLRRQDSCDIHVLPIQHS